MRAKYLCALSVLFMGPALSFTGNTPVSKQGGVQAAQITTVTSAVPGVLMQKTSSGEINWTDGYVATSGEGKIIKGPNLRICDSMARRAALLDAQAKVLRMVQGIRLDGTMTVKESIARNQRLFYGLKGLIARVRAFDQHKNKGVYIVRIRVPLYGTRGIQGIFHDEYVKSGSGRARQTRTRCVVIDARGTGLTPALFIKIKDQTGRDVYSTRDVAVSDLLNKGMAVYVTSTALQQDDVEVKALRAAGPQHSDIVVSFADADRLKSVDGSLPACPVVVIADPFTE